MFAEIDADHIERPGKRGRSAPVHSHNDDRPAIDGLGTPVILSFGTAISYLRRDDDLDLNWLPATFPRTRTFPTGNIPSAFSTLR